MRAKPTFEPRKCELCGESYAPAGAFQKFCSKCRKTKHNEYIRTWAHKLKREDPERYRKLLESSKPKTEEQKRGRREYGIRWREAHPGYSAAYMRKWRSENPERWEEIQRSYITSEKGVAKERRRVESRRRRRHEDPEYMKMVLSGNVKNRKRRKLQERRNERNRVSHVVNVQETSFRYEVQTHSSMLASAGIVSI